MPIFMRLPKRGFNKPNRKRWAELSIRRLEQAIEAGVIDVKKDVDAAALVKAGGIRRAHDGVRLIGSGKLSAGVNLKVAGATAGATKIVEKAKGSVTIVEGRPERVAKADKAAKPAAKKAAPKKAAPKKEAAPKAEAKKPVEKKPAAKKPAAKKAPAKKAEADDLTKISGIGPVFAGRLAEEGITTYLQVSKLTAKKIAELDEKHDLKGNITNDDWPGQAKKLMADKK